MLLELARPALDVGLVVHEREAMTRFYAETLGLEPEESLVVTGGDVLRFRNWIELLEPTELDDGRGAFITDPDGKHR